MEYEQLIRKYQLRQRLLDLKDALQELVEVIDEVLEELAKYAPGGPTESSQGE